jgi:3',5'-cyclic-nucleotide phosphodiesterase
MVLISPTEKPLKKNTLRFQPPPFTRIHKGYFISHAHLDHVSGLIINSPADVAKQFMQQNAWI